MSKKNEGWVEKDYIGNSEQILRLILSGRKRRGREIAEKEGERESTVGSVYPLRPTQKYTSYPEGADNPVSVE